MGLHKTAISIFTMVVLALMLLIYCTLNWPTIILKVFGVTVVVLWFALLYFLIYSIVRGVKRNGS
jgi:hypothetical protein